jgi:hypothetical protein
MERAAASVSDVTTVATDFLREHADVCSGKLAGQLGANVRGTDADVVITNPPAFRAGGWAMKGAAAPIADVAAIVVEAVRTGHWGAYIRRTDTYIVLADPPGLRTGKRTRESATAAVANVAAVLRFIRRIHTTEARTNSRQPGADVVLASPSLVWAGFSAIERVATTVADRSAEPTPVLICAGDGNAGIACGIGGSVQRTGLVGCVRTVSYVRQPGQVNHDCIRSARIGIRARVRDRIRILATTPGIRASVSCSP